VRFRLLALALALVAACGGEDLAGPATGSIRVAVTTSGDGPDADGYLLAVDEAAGERIGASGVRTFTDLPVGSHQVTLGDLASNCAPAGQLRRAVAVEAGATAELEYDITCQAAPGGLRLVTSTTGNAPDPDGYEASIDGDVPLALPAAGTVAVSPVMPGDHTLAMSGLAPNCTLDGPNPRTVTVAPGAMLTVDLAVGCGAPVGTLTVVVATAGPRPDPDGYEVTIGEDQARPLGANASLTVPGLPVGDVRVGLSGVAPNCTLAGRTPRTVEVTNGGSSQLTFEVSCVPAGNGTILFTSDRTGTSHLFRVRDDGSRLVDLTPAAEACCADWSPDGTRIVFTRGAEISVMNQDGSGSVGLGVSGGGTRWSPDGHKLLFTSGGTFTTDGTIQVMNPDGSGVTALTTGRSPDWSPDGGRIVFQRTGPCVADICGADIYVMAADGSQLRKLTNSQGAFDSFGLPAWSPDGGKIAYRRTAFFGGSGLYVMNPDGSDNARLTEMGGLGRPVWSPDGSAIAFAGFTADGGSTELMVMSSTGGVGVVIAGSPGSEYPESWN
jgi:TolB protein